LNACRWTENWILSKHKRDSARLALLAFVVTSSCWSLAKTISVKECGVLKKARATYILQNDVSSEGTCFSVQDDEITLDLNGHTITYATRDQGGRRHAVIGSACYGPHLDNNPCGGTFKNFTVQNGKIVQGPSAAPFSDAIRIGQVGGTNLTVTNVEFDISAPSAKAIHTTYAKGGHRISRNTIRSRVTSIGSRHQLDGVTIKLETENTASSAPSQVHHNTIIGSAQGGILVTAPRSRVYENTISLNANYTNDFCIYAWAPGAEIFGNQCDNTQGTSMGRGIHVSSPAVSVHHNVIKVRELPRNEEYSGCQTGGAYGIQLEQSADKTRVYENDVTAVADACDAIAMRATTIPATASNEIYDNRFAAVRVATAKGKAVAFSPNNVSGGILLRGNRLISDTAAVLVPWDGAQGIRFENNTFEIGSNPPPDGWAMFVFNNAKPSEELYVRDPKFIGRASATAKMRPVGFGKWAGQAGFRVEWTTTIRVASSGNSPVDGALVTITDAAGTNVFSGTTNAKGIAIAPLTEEHFRNTKAEAVTKQKSAPYLIQVEAPGIGSAKRQIEALGAQEVEIVLKATK
jgi:hypothetical protein